MSRDFNAVLDDINFAAQRRVRQKGFTRGYSLGEESGWREGYSYGVSKASQVAAEIGFYQGYVSAWITSLVKDEASKQRKLTALKTLLEMTRAFPKTNMQDEDTVQRLARIRAKFKQVNALLSTGDHLGSFGAPSFSRSFDLGDVNPPQTPIYGGSSCSEGGSHKVMNEFSF